MGGGGGQSSGDLPFCAEVGFDRRGTCVIAHGHALTWTFLGAAVTAVCVCLGGGGVTHSFSFKNHQFLGYLLGGGGSQRSSVLGVLTGLCTPLSENSRCSLTFAEVDAETESCFFLGSI